MTLLRYVYPTPQGILVVWEARLGHLVVENEAKTVVYFEHYAEVELPNKSTLEIVLLLVKCFKVSPSKRHLGLDMMESVTRE